MLASVTNKISMNDPLMVTAKPGEDIPTMASQNTFIKSQRSVSQQGIMSTARRQQEKAAIDDRTGRNYSPDAGVNINGGYRS